MHRRQGGAGSLSSPFTTVRDQFVQGGEGKSVCVRCGGHEAMEASDFCINCKVDLFRSFGEASHELFTDMGAPGYIKVLEDRLGNL